MIDPQQYNAPWRVSPEYTMIVDADGGWVCAMAAIDTKRRMVPMAQNAKLVAAAPLLLLAAEAALEYLSSSLNGDPHDPAIIAWNLLAEAVSAATA